MFRHRPIAMVALSAVAPLAAAQDDPDKAIHEIVVTALKRESTIQDVPFSIAVQSEEQIRNSGAGNIAEFARNVAGLTITDLGPGQSQVAIRGLSAGQVIRDQPGVKEQVGVYLDESPISVALFTPDLTLFDLERIEVLRGPQGTLFGAGSTSGTLRYITAQPRLDRTEGAAEVDLREGTGSDFGGAVRGAYNIPLGENLALRMVGYYEELAGFIDAVQPDGSVREDVNGGDKRGARISMLYQPNDVLTITPRVIYQELDTDGFPRIDAFNILANPFTTTQPTVTLGERQQFTQLEEGLEDDFMLADVKLDYDMGNGLTLTSISSYTDRDVLVVRDATSLTGSITFDIGGTPDEVRISSPLFDATDLQSFSQELRVSSSAEGAFSWVAGAYYQDVDRKYGQTLPTPGYDAITLRQAGTVSADTGAPPDTPFFSRLAYDFKQFALFGEGTYRFDDRWALTAGLRYYDFEEDRNLVFAGFFADNSLNGPGETSSDGFSPRAIVTFDVNEDVQLNAQVSRGFRLGGINDPLNLNLCSAGDRATFGGRPTWDDEKVMNYELGSKMRIADGLVLVNTAVFYSDIDGLQAVADAGTCSSRVIFNAQAETVGAELEVFARPNPSWDFGVALTYVTAEITESVVPATGGAPIAGIRDGNRLPTAPEFQAVASVTFIQPVLATREGFVNFTVQHVGSSYTQLAHQEQNFGLIAAGGPAGSARLIPFGDPSVTSLGFDPKLPDYQIGNLRLGVRDEQWEVAAFINNIWDEQALLSLDTERGRSARIGYLTNTPRSYGLSVRRSF